MAAFKLSKPISINGASVQELPYDFDTLNARDKLEATKAYTKAGNIVSVQELDPAYHLFIFAAAVRKADPSIEIDDVLRMSFKDAAKAEGMVRDFFFIGSES
ncbi:hypothetical protein [Gorillibacterium sp. sgz5001074]|uniref:hypothetical protein n=1 Tax=Gorillibacterium sp. sgz5001074 TaxID=3446695 RepID=UPI003F67F664